MQLSLEVLQGDVSKILASVDALAIRMDEKDKGQAQDLLPRFPIESRDGWNEFNNALSEAEVRRQLVRYLTLS